MKKLLLTLGLATVFVTAGCAQDSNNQDNADQADQKEETNGDKKADNNKEAQSVLLDTQMELVTEIRPHNTKIANVQSKIEELASIEDEQELKEAKTEVMEQAKEAQAAADEAIKTIESFEVKGELSEEMTTTLNTALEDLNTYFTEAKTALDQPTEADFTKANESFDAFEQKMGKLYEEVGLLAPNMKKELS